MILRASATETPSGSGWSITYILVSSEWLGLNSLGRSLYVDYIIAFNPQIEDHRMAARTRADRQTTIRLPSEVYEQLSINADLRGSSVGEEIRRRLVESFSAVNAGGADKKTRELLNVITVMAEDLGENFPPWHEDAGSYRAFMAALARWLRRYEPEGDTVLKPKAGTELLFRRRGPTLENVVMMLIGVANSYVAGPPDDEDEGR
jgi:hypothetical protein